MTKAGQKLLALLNEMHPVKNGNGIDWKGRIERIEQEAAAPSPALTREALLAAYNAGVHGDNYDPDKEAAALGIPPAGLDAERLARAWSTSFAHIEPDDFRIQKLVRAYAALSKIPPPTEEERA